jgi:hypothetical protein
VPVAVKSSPSQKPYAPRSDWLVYALLAAVSVLVRIPFVKNFDLVSFDGTYYVNQARALWTAAPQPGAFPIGYPFFISLFLPVVGDGVRAAQAVSFLAGLGSLFVLFHLARRFLDRHLAFYCALFLALTPLFISLSLATFSESTYVFWMLLALLFHAQGRDAMTGLAGGVAAITRPEMLAVVGLLSLMRFKTPRRALALLAVFTAVYSVNTLTFYHSTGDLTILPKSSFFGTLAQKWEGREKTVGVELDTASTSETLGAPGVSGGEIVTRYFKKIPRELYTLGRNVLFVTLILAAFGFYKRPSFLLVAFVPFLIGPLFTVRVMDRYLLPYVPIVILYAMVGADTVRKKRVRQIAFALLVLAAALGPVVNARLLTLPVDEHYPEMKTAGVFLRGLVRDDDKIADRKPYVAFYSGAEYTEIPHDDYERTIQYMMDNDVRFLSLHYPASTSLRPLLAPLLTHRDAVVGEVRLSQIYAHPDGVVIYERIMNENPLELTRITYPPTTNKDMSPDWSPDGTEIVFSSDRRGNSDIFAVSVDGDGALEVIVDGPGEDVQPDWSPDGTEIVFSSNRSGAWDIFTVDVATKRLRQVTEDAEVDRAPRWTPDGNRIVFASNRTGDFEIWTVDPTGGSMTQLTNSGSNNYPSVSPDGSRIAFTRRGKELVILDLQSGRRITAVSPRDVNYAPVWSPDGRYLAVSAKDWGSVDIYLLTSDGRRSVLLTKNATIDGKRAFDALPAWSPDGLRLAAVSSVNGPRSIYIIEDLQPFLARLTNPPKSFVFTDDKHSQ